MVDSRPFVPWFSHQGPRRTGQGACGAWRLDLCSWATFGPAAQEQDRFRALSRERLLGLRKIDEWKNRKETVLGEVQEADLDTFNLLGHVHDSDLDFGLLGDAQSADIHIRGSARYVEKSQVGAFRILLYDVDEARGHALRVSTDEVAEGAKAAL